MLTSEQKSKISLVIDQLNDLKSFPDVLQFHYDVRLGIAIDYLKQFIRDGCINPLKLDYVFQKICTCLIWIDSNYKTICMATDFTVVDETITAYRLLIISISEMYFWGVIK